jgi:hypothetical protein
VKKYDVFISYAVEEKNIVAEKLALLLEEKGIKVYFAGNELSVGSSVSEVIYVGLRQSRFVILILSPAYTRHWPAIERSNFAEKEQKQNQRLIFPVRHNMTHDEICQKYPDLADRWGLSTEIGVEAIADRLFTAIKKKKKRDRFKMILRLSLIIVAAFIIFFPGVLFYREKKKSTSLPTEAWVKMVVQENMKKFQEKLNCDFNKQLAKSEEKPGSFRSMVNDNTFFLGLDGFERNEYQFTSEWGFSSNKKKLDQMGIKLTESPYLAYGVSVPNVYILEHVCKKRPKINFVSAYAISNALGATCTIDTIFRCNNEAHAIISYTQNIRVVYKTLRCSKETDFVKKQQVKIFGFMPKEEYIFDNVNNKWVFREAR